MPFFETSQPWLTWQLLDSAFPAGGFAHSSGMEVLCQLAEVGPMDAVIERMLWQAGHTALPFVGAAHLGEPHLTECDALCDAFTSNHVANRASRTQGRAWVATCARVFPNPELQRLHAAVRSGALAAHLAPCFGASLVALGLPRRAAQALFLHHVVRGLTSAAVRLGLVGPLEGQRLHAGATPILDAVMSRCAALALEDAAQTDFLLDLFAGMHDGLDCRLFQS